MKRPVLALFINRQLKLPKCTTKTPQFILKIPLCGLCVACGWHAILNVLWGESALPREIQNRLQVLNDSIGPAICIIVTVKICTCFMKQVTQTCDTQYHVDTGILVVLLDARQRLFWIPAFAPQRVTRATFGRTHAQGCKPSKHSLQLVKLFENHGRLYRHRWGGSPYGILHQGQTVPYISTKRCQSLRRVIQAHSLQLRLCLQYFGRRLESPMRFHVNVLKLLGCMTNPR